MSITFDRFVSVARLRSAQELPPRCRGKGGAPPGWVALCEVGTSERARTRDRLGPLAPAQQGKLDARFPSQPAGAAGAVAIANAYGGEGPARARQHKTRRRAARACGHSAVCKLRVNPTRDRRGESPPGHGPGGTERRSRRGEARPDLPPKNEGGAGGTPLLLDSWLVDRYILILDLARTATADTSPRSPTRC